MNHTDTALYVNSQRGQSCIIFGLYGKALPGVIQSMSFVHKCQGPAHCCAFSKGYNRLHLEKTNRLFKCIVISSVPSSYGMDTPISFHTICFSLDNRV